MLRVRPIKTIMRYKHLDCRHFWGCSHKHVNISQIVDTVVFVPI